MQEKSFSAAFNAISVAAGTSLPTITPTSPTRCTWRIGDKHNSVRRAAVADPDTLVQIAVAGQAYPVAFINYLWGHQLAKSSDAFVLSIESKS